GDGSNARAHRECKHKKYAGGGHAPQRARAVLRPQIQFKRAEGQEILSERSEGEQRAAKGCRIETDRAKQENRQGKSQPDEPGGACHEEQAKSPAAMSREISGNRKT